MALAVLAPWSEHTRRPTRTIACLGVSTEKQADRGVSLKGQRAKAEACAQLHDLELVEVIVDAGVSAKPLDRPGLQRALTLLRFGQAEALPVAKLDRLTRRVVHLGELLEEYFAGGKWALLFVGEQIDTRSAAGRCSAFSRRCLSGRVRPSASAPRRRCSTRQPAVSTPVAGRPSATG